MHAYMQSKDVAGHYLDVGLKGVLVPCWVW